MSVAEATGQPADLYYDPFDIAIDVDPHPTWKRLRDEAPLYWNDKWEFFAISRWDDVEPALKDFDTYRSGNGSTLDMIKADIDFPPGIILVEDPPIHDVHRALMSRVFTPKRMNALEPQIREYCARALDPHVGEDGFDFVTDLGAFMPMRVIGMLLGIPEEDQELIRDKGHEGLSIDEDYEITASEIGQGTDFEAYIDWRVDNPSDDLMTELLNAEFTDHEGVTRTLTRTEVLSYVGLIAGAGNETTARLIGWTGKLLGEHPDQRRRIAEDRSLIPNAIEEVLRYEAPSPVQARTVARDVEVHGHVVPEGSCMVILNGSANRDERHFDDADTFDIDRHIGHHLSFGYGLHFCLGAALARIEGRVALDEVLNRWPDWEVDWDNAKQGHTPHVRGWDRLPVKVG